MIAGLSYRGVTFVLVLGFWGTFYYRLYDVTSGSTSKIMFLVLTVRDYVTAVVWRTCKMFTAFLICR
jgi:hypothetical protein